MSGLRQYLAHLLKQAYPEQEKLSLAIPRHQQAWRCFRGRCPYLRSSLNVGPALQGALGLGIGLGVLE